MPPEGEHTSLAAQGMESLRFLMNPIPYASGYNTQALMLEFLFDLPLMITGPRENTRA